MQATQNLPQVIPFEQSTTEISQTELSLLVSLRNRLEQLQAQIVEAEESIKARLEAGSTVEAGLLRALLRTYQRRSVAWRAVCERELGEAYCKRVLAATQAETYTQLIVEA